MAGVRDAGARASALLLLGGVVLLSGCGGEPEGGDAPPSAAQVGSGAAANSPFGKTSDETTLPPQGKPPAPGEDVGARARSAAGVQGGRRPQ